MKIKKVLLILGILSILVLTGCSQKEKSPQSCLDKVEEDCRKLTTTNSEYNECKMDNFPKECGLKECLNYFGMKKVNDAPLTETEKNTISDYNEQAEICFQA